MSVERSFHFYLDWNFDSNAESLLRQALEGGMDPNLKDPESGEGLIHVAARRRRLEPIKWLVEFGADLELENQHGKTAYVHCLRRGFDEIAAYLKGVGTRTTLQPADRFAVAVVGGDLESAKQIMAKDPFVVKTGNPEEDRLLADIAGRPQLDLAQFLVQAGADMEAKALDGGAALHQAAWFGQKEIAGMLIENNANLNCFENDHDSSPIGWAVHGAKYSGDSENRQADYSEIVRLLIDAGCSLKYPASISEAQDPPSVSFLDRLRRDASGPIARLLSNG